MKKLLLLTILFTSIILANTTFDVFIDTQMKVEKKLLEQNLTKEERDNALKNPDNFLAEFISTSYVA